MCIFSKCSHTVKVTELVASPSWSLRCWWVTAAPRYWWWTRDRRSERFWTSCLRRRTVTAASPGACVRPTLSYRLVRWTHSRHICIPVSGLQVEPHFCHFCLSFFREGLWGPRVFCGAAVCMATPQRKQNLLWVKTSEVCDVHRPSGEYEQKNVLAFSSRQSLRTYCNT